MLNCLKRIESNNPLSLPNQVITIYDYQDRIIYSTDDDHLLDITTDLINEVRQKNDIRIKQDQFEILGQFYTSQYDRFVVFAAATDIFGFKKLKRLRLILADCIICQPGHCLFCWPIVFKPGLTSYLEYYDPGGSNR